MINLTESPNHTLAKTVDQACSKIAPLWPLSHFVAVNPFVGFANQSFAATAAQHQRIQGADTVMPLDWYRQKYTTSEIGMEDIRAAVATATNEIKESFSAAKESLTVDNMIELLNHQPKIETPALQPGPFSGFLDERENTHWQHFIREETAKWCAAYFDQGQSSWSLPWKSKTLYQAWQRAASLDRNPQCNGLKHFCEMASQRPPQPFKAIESALLELNVPTELTEEFLYQILLITPGWAGHMRYLDRENTLRDKTSDWLIQLLAIILNYEVILFHHFEGDHDRILGWKRILMEDPMDTGEPLVCFELAQRLVWQSSFEHALEQTIKVNIQPNTPKQNEQPVRPDAQAAFCIDVRSEVYRRSLEATNPHIQTIGFAGFFGIPIEHNHADQEATQARCPVLLAPQVKTCEHSGGLCKEEAHAIQEASAQQRESLRGWKLFREAATSSFSFVETVGLSYAYKLFKDTFGFKPKKSSKVLSSPTIIDELSIDQQVATAESILRGLNLTENVAPLVLLCGHGSETKNNPYASGLDCGACGGHAGDANARVAVSLLNNPEVRKALKEKSIHIPEDTHFIAGLHNTTTDEVTLFDLEKSPTEVLPTIFGLQANLHRASNQTALERGLQMTTNGKSINSLNQIQKRSCDWSQVRPEWGLAGNTAFIVAPRSWTQKANLKGRAFLHEYNANDDPDAAILEAIMGGPLVVGSWINLQYYGSAVDNGHYGSGHKSIHNVVGGIGVALGNENDLRPGLPFQSVHDGNQLVHQPTRLLACIAAEPGVIEQILSRNSHLTDLIENQWIHLIALGTDGKSWKRRLPNARWQCHHTLNTEN